MPLASQPCPGQQALTSRFLPSATYARPNPGPTGLYSTSITWAVSWGFPLMRVPICTKLHQHALPVLLESDVDICRHCPGLLPAVPWAARQGAQQCIWGKAVLAGDLDKPGAPKILATALHAERCLLKEQFCWAPSGCAPAVTSSTPPSSRDPLCAHTPCPAARSGRARRRHPGSSSSQSARVWGGPSNKKFIKVRLGAKGANVEGRPAGRAIEQAMHQRGARSKFRCMLPAEQGERCMPGRPGGLRTCTTSSSSSLWWRPTLPWGGTGAKLGLASGRNISRPHPA